MKRRFTSQVLGGLILIGLGGLFLLRQMGYTDFSLGSMISTYWPVILIILGVKRFLSPDDEHSRFSATLGGFFFLAIGVFFLGRNLEWFDFSAGDFFKMLIPVMLIGGGLAVIFKPRGTTPPVPPAPPDFYPPEPGKSPLDAKPPAPLESTLDEQFEQKFGKSAGAGGRDWNDYLHKDTEDEDEEQGDSLLRRMPGGRRSRNAMNADARSVRNAMPAATANGMRSFRIPGRTKKQRTARLLSGMSIWAASISS